MANGLLFSFVSTCPICKTAIHPPLQKNILFSSTLASNTLRRHRQCHDIFQPKCILMGFRASSCARTHAFWNNLRPGQVFKAICVEVGRGLAKKQTFHMAVEGLLFY